MTDDDILNTARNALPDRLKAATLTIIRGGQAPMHAQVLERKALDSRLLEELGRMLETRLPGTAQTDNTVVVAATEETALGSRTTVVQMRDGVVKRVITQA